MCADNPSSIPRGLRVLVVEDNRDGANTLAMLLRKWGCEVLTCYSGEDCLVTAGAFRPEVAILDLAMPRMNGFQVAEWLRQELPGTMLVAYTGFSSAEHREHARKVGFDHYLLKPANPAVLRALLATSRGASDLSPGQKESA